MQKYTRALLLCTLAIAAAACSPRSSADYWPLSDGARWEYDAYVTDTNGRKPLGKVVTRVEGTDVINGKKYFRLVTVAPWIPDAPGSRTDPDHYRIGPDGVFELFDQKHSEQPVFLLPAQNGKTFEYQLSEYVTERCVMSIEDVSLLDKTYKNCLVVTSHEFYPQRPTESGPTSATYFAAGVGIVKIVMSQPDGSIVVQTLAKH